MKIKILLGFILILILICIWTSASFAIETATVYLESNNDVVEIGNEVEITVNLKEISTSAFNLTIYFDNAKWEYVSKMGNTNVVSNRILYVWYDATGGRESKSGELVKFKFKAKAEGVSTFSINGEFYSQSGQLIKTSFEEKQVKVGKEKVKIQTQNEEGTSLQTNNAYLQALRLDIAGLSPSFDKDTYEYNLTVKNNVETIDVLAISENPKATINISGNTNLKEGKNNIKIKVTSEDKKKTKTYTIRRN